MVYRNKENERAYHKKNNQRPVVKKRRAFYTRRHNDRIRMEVLVAYGGTSPKCMCECGCSENCLAMLDLDHVNNDGQAHYKEAKARGSKFFKWLKRNGFPTNRPIRVLCCNCNVGRQRNAGICPRIRIVPVKERIRPQDRQREIAADLATAT